MKPVFAAIVSLLVAVPAGAQVPIVPQERSAPRFEKVGAMSSQAWSKALPTFDPTGTAIEKEFDAAARFARDSAPALYDAWQLAAEHPEAAKTLRAQMDPRQLALQRALLARDADRLETELKKVTDAGKREDVRNHARYLAARLNDILALYGPAGITIFAEGDIRGVATGDSTKLGTGTGSLGASLALPRWGVLQASIAVASSVDTITSAFGGTVLAPSTGRGLRSGVLSFYGDGDIPYLPNRFHAYGTLSTYRWRGTFRPEGATADSTILADATMLGFGLLRRHLPGCCRVLDNPVMFAVEWGVAGRYLSGNATSHPEWRAAILGTDKTFFYGPEVGLQLSFGKVTGSLAGYYLLAGKRPNVDGLTNLQVVAAFTASSEVFRGPVTR